MTLPWQSSISNTSVLNVHDCPQFCYVSFESESEGRRVGGDRGVGVERTVERRGEGESEAGADDTSRFSPEISGH